MSDLKPFLTFKNATSYVPMLALFAALSMVAFWDAEGGKAHASNPKSDAPSLGVIQGQFQKVDANIRVDTVKSTPFSGLFEVRLADGQIAYSNSDATYVLSGKLFELSDYGLIDLTDKARQVDAVSMLSSLDESTLVKYSPSTVKGRITVFTDVDCPYCQKMHADIPALNDLGIEVRYMAFPRSGPDSDTGVNMINAWCSDDRHAALDALMNREPLESPDCESGPVVKHLEYALKLGITGTPSIVYDDGVIQPGFSSVEDIATRAISASASK